MQARYKMQTADFRLGLKCRLRPISSHRLIFDIFTLRRCYTRQFLLQLVS